MLNLLFFFPFYKSLWKDTVTVGYIVDNIISIFKEEN